MSCGHTPSFHSKLRYQFPAPHNLRQIRFPAQPGSELFYQLTPCRQNGETALLGTGKRFSSLLKNRYYLIGLHHEM